jgi:hypothetical protein
MTKDIVVLNWKAPTTSDRRALEIAAFLGAEVKCVSVTATALGDGASIPKLVPRCTCLIVNVETLAKAADAMQAGINGLRSLICSAEHALIYGFQATDRHARILRVLSSGGLLGVQPLSDAAAQFHVAQDHRAWCGQFSGLSLGAADATRDNVFVEGSEERRQNVMIRLGDKPFFLRTEDGGSQVFFLASSELADLDEQVRRETRLLSWFSGLVPVMMFLRGALGNRVWHNDHPQACLIIDDPLLKKRYGFLDYRRLVEITRQQKFSACIAFIPWNYRRSSKQVAKLVSSWGMPYLCVHGCDHTAAEFGTTHLESLCGKAQLALDRMRAHSRLSGLPFDDIMVFPQGVFSVEAMKALSATGYLAAINTHLQPSTMPEGLALRDMLDVAVTRFADCPLFGRHYPRDLEEIAFDLFMGKPAFVVEHHGYFRDGYRALQTFVSRLNALDERLQWTSPATICSQACLTRTADDGDVHVRFYTNRFSLKNDGIGPLRYILFRRQSPDGPLPSVTINGRDGDSQRNDGNLEISLTLDAGQTAEIKVVSGALDRASFSYRPTTIQKAKVRVRRLLSEFRDNYMHIVRVRWKPAQ